MNEVWVDEAYVRRLPALFRLAKQRIRISLYSVVPTGKPAKKSSGLLLEHLATAATHGIECLVLLNMVARGAYLRAQNTEAITKMRRHGIQTRQLVGSRCNHAKFVLIDEQFAVVGSHNWSPSSLRRNHELSMMTDDPAAVSKLALHFDHLWSTAVKLKPGAGTSVPFPLDDTDEG